MIDKKEKKDGLMIYYVEKDYNDDKLENVMNTKLKRSDIKTIINHDADIYTSNGELLMRFRKNKLNKEKIKMFYDNVIQYATRKTNNRGSASGSKRKSVYDNPKIMTNIIGYFDKLSPKQKFKFKKMGLPLPKCTVRKTRFLDEFPEKFEKAIPFIEEIDKYYKKYIPDKYSKQKRKANQTPYHISDTAFTTVTLNVNYQTYIHTDKGDDIEGFGNLSVIEHGKFTGGETCFPQYGIGVDVRTGDVLYMNVHQPHANLPIILESPDAKRLSIVCYLRESIWKQTKGKTKKFMKRHNTTLKKIRTI